tara:strand:- start:15 stop:755 length:741 start_codon:yes stop_codon:yes gene_type:complete
MKADFIISMHRTGHHAVAIWLLHQKQGITDFSITTLTSWLFAVGDDSELFMYANNPLKTGPNEHPDKPKLPLIINDIQPEGLIVSHEQDTIQNSLEKAGQSPYSFNKPIVVIRDFRNWVASCLKMALRDNKIIEDVINNDRVSEYRNHLINYSKFDCYYILFNDWASNKAYREVICNDLGYVFTDAAKDQLSIFGGGSSFDGMQYLKTASQMDVNNRYKEVETHPYFEMMMSKHEEVLKLSDTIFQ